VRLWDVARERELKKLRGHTGIVFSVAFSPDGTRLVSGSGDATARVWNIPPLATAPRTPNSLPVKR
jgi:WD40 repeat protein